MTIAFKSAGTRQLKNSLARWLITLGGVSVLFTLVLIFLYLLYVIKPIFEDAHIEPVQSFAIEQSESILATGLDELKELAYTVEQSGQINYYRLNTINGAVGEKPIHFH